MRSAERVIEIEGRCGLQPIWDEIFLLADWLHVPHVRWLERVVVCLVVPGAKALGGAISFPQLLP